MFYYVISLAGTWDGITEDDVCVTEDRGWARVAMTVLGLPVKEVAK